MQTCNCSSFGLADHVVTMQDKTAIGVTDAAAYLDKPRKVSRPVEANDLDIRLHSYLS